MIIGKGRRGFADSDDPANAEFNSPQGVCLVNPDNLYICGKQTWVESTLTIRGPPPFKKVKF